MRLSTRMTRLSSAGAFALSSVFLAFGLAWVLLYSLNFSYGRWHDWGGIGEAIDKYGPQNYYRLGFGETTKAQREVLFSQISYAVHRDGKGLEDIAYKVEGYPRQTLLTDDEIGHLTDVAHLVNKMEWLIGAFALLWLIMMVFYAKAGVRPPSVIAQVVALLVVIALFVLILLIVGPTKAFSQMHEWVFPPGHPWFFYYQESLMSTMMWAPVLFGWIAAEWAVFTVIFFGVIQWFSQKGLLILQRRLTSTP